MAVELKNTMARLKEAQKKQFEQLKSFYKTGCADREQLRELMNAEDGMLLRLQQDVMNQSKAAVLKGAEQDGVEFPKLIWAQYIEPNLKAPVFTSLRQQAPVIDIPAPHPAQQSETANAHGGAGRIAMYAVSGAGAAMAVGGLVMNPINGLLVGLGVAVTAVGVVVLVGGAVRGKSGEPVPAKAPEKAPEQVRDEIDRLLEEQLNACRKVIHAWNQNLLTMFRKAVEAEEANKV